MRPLLKYPGGKARISDWIVDHFPAFDIYVEPFFGGGSVFLELARRRTPRHAVINDLSGDVVTFFKVLRDCPDDLAHAISLTPWAQDEYDAAREREGISDLERARRFAVMCYQGYGSRLSRTPGWRIHGTEWANTVKTWRRFPVHLAAVAHLMLGVEIHNTDAVRLIQMYDGENTLVYADPPYPIAARRSRDTMYEHEMTLPQHEQLLGALVAHPGPVVVSGYTHPLYEERLAGWYRVEKAARDSTGTSQTEVIWINRDLGRRLI